jgi:hypothetical protein
MIGLFVSAASTLKPAVAFMLVAIFGLHFYYKNETRASRVLDSEVLKNLARLSISIMSYVE